MYHTWYVLKIITKENELPAVMLVLGPRLSVECNNMRYILQSTSFLFNIYVYLILAPMVAVTGESHSLLFIHGDYLFWLDKIRCLLCSVVLYELCISKSYTVSAYC